MTLIRRHSMSWTSLLSACLASAALFSTAPAAAQAAAVQAPPAAFQIRANEIVLGDGTRVENGLIVVRDGKIAAVGADVAVDEALPLHEHDGVVTAGLIACQTRSGTDGEEHDGTRSVLPGGRVLFAYDPEDRDFAKALKAGITTVVLAPSAANLVGGRTAVVKTHGKRVLRGDGHLSLSFAKESLLQSVGNFAFFFGDVDEHGGPVSHESPVSQGSQGSQGSHESHESHGPHEAPTPDESEGGETETAHAPADTAADGGPETTDRSRRGARFPTSYPGAMRELRRLFDAGQGLFGRAARGEFPVMLMARDRNEVERAARFALDRGLKGTIVGAPLAGDPSLIPLLAKSGLGVVLGPFQAGQKRGSLEAVQALQAAGVPVGFALDAPRNAPESLRMSAVMALSAGADPAALVRALTSDAARIAGVEGRVGALKVGEDADLVLWSGHPLDLTSSVEAVYVDGALAHRGGSDQ